MKHKVVPKAKRINGGESRVFKRRDSAIRAVSTVPVRRQ